MIKRDITKTLLDLSKSYPVVTVTGPRQSGKTTLVRAIFPKKPYSNLENLDEREMANADPRGFLDRFPKGAILDEIQRAPDLMSYIQTIVDEKEIPGMFILTGSQNLSLLPNISQSLAGRTAILKLMPFNFAEVDNYGTSYSVDDFMLYGFFPAVYNKKLNPTIAYRNYYETYIERDLRQLINIKNLNLFQTFVRLCAGRIGQLFNASGLANEVGVSVATIKSWMSILEASFIVFLIGPYYENINKRIVKSRKIYFSDIGLAAYLVGIESAKQAMNHPLRGALFESMVIMELIKTRYNKGLDHNLYFYRDSNHNEVDILFKHSHKLVPIEIKSSSTFNTEFLKGLKYIKKILPNKINNGFLIYAGKVEQSIQVYRIINYKKAGKILI